MSSAMWPHSGQYSVENREPLSKRRFNLSQYSTFRLKETPNDGPLRNEPKTVPCKEDDSDVKGDLSRYSTLLAMFTALVSGFLFAASSYLAKKLYYFPSGTLTAFLLLFYVVGGLPMSVFYWEKVIKSPKYLMTKNLPVCIAVHVSTFLWLMSMRRLSLFDANVIIVSYPIFATILSRIFLKEACSILQVAAIFMTCLGLCLLTKIPWMMSDGPSVSLDSGGLGIAFSCTAAYVLLVILTRRDLRDVHYGANQIYVALLGSPIDLLIIFLVDKEPRMPECGVESAAVIVLLIIFFMGSYLLSISLQLGEVGLVSVVRSAADVIFTFFFQAVIMGEPPDTPSIIGGVFVVSSVVLYGIKSSLQEIVQKSERMKKFAFLF